MNNKNIITGYYFNIDKQQISEVLDVFASDAVYERADISYTGILEISEFFFNKRQIRGQHILDRITSCDDLQTFIVTGRFVGMGAEGDPRTVDFADVWEFNDLNKIKKRKTYLALGYEYVER